MQTAPKKMLIIGAGGLGRMTLETALSLNYECAFLDDDPKLQSVCGVKVIGTLDNLPNLVSDYNYCICAIGENTIREKFTKLALTLGYNVPNIINKTAYISDYAKLGFGVIILNNVCVQNGAVVGNGVVITSNSEIHHDCVIGDYSLIYSCTVIRTFSKIGKRVKIGSTVTISNSSTVLDDEIIEDGSTINNRS